MNSGPSLPDLAALQISDPKRIIPLTRLKCHGVAAICPSLANFMFNVLERQKLSADEFEAMLAIAQ
jgi:hypothetical protein